MTVLSFHSRPLLTREKKHFWQRVASLAVVSIPLDIRIIWWCYEWETSSIWCWIVAWKSLTPCQLAFLILYCQNMSCVMCHESVLDCNKQQWWRFAFISTQSDQSLLSGWGSWKPQFSHLKTLDKHKIESRHLLYCAKQTTSETGFLLSFGLNGILTIIALVFSAHKHSIKTSAV